MARIVLVTGGCRSGKSAYAQQLAESLPPTRLFVATCPVTDEEMRHRIEQHRRARQDRGWETVEEQCHLADVFGCNMQHHVLLVDCITLWINNLMYHAKREGRPFTEADVAEECRRVLDAAETCPSTVIFVTNEVGLGVVPENAQARRYRDLVGRANQILAARAATVTLLCCGIAVQLKDAAQDHFARTPGPSPEGEGRTARTPGPSRRRRGE